MKRRNSLELTVNRCVQKTLYLYKKKELLKKFAYLIMSENICFFKNKNKKKKDE